ncbi:WD40-repeat-containing domain protein [Ephemerocybe angulata]|uniref:Polyadenylation factor subunit 2 n=1 Tax=Ephemerocybe angulata TaxID=980116 RepID=A0A8H6M1U6_9AGAR|nr:WD40-repeat-containing domain protein [Tulosesus angulatus]
MALPILLPPKAIPKAHSLSHLEWTPTRYLEEPQPPSNEDARLQEEFIQKQLLEGKIVKKTRPRRTVDYNGGMGRWVLSRKLRPNPTYIPHLRPAPPYIIDLLPPKAYTDNASTSLCTKFVHTSTNKIRCPVNVVTWTPEARRVLTGSTSGEFTLWNGLTFNFETILQAHDTAICAMRFTHSGAYLASADKTGIIKYFEPNMNNLTAWQGSQSKEAIRGISFSPDDQRFATASDDSSVRIWSFAESRFESVLSGHGWDVKCVEWHPTKGLIVSGSKDSQVKFWDPRTGTCLSTLHQHKNTIQALAWSPNGNLVASASRDQTVRVFDIRAMKEFRVLKGHKKEVCSIAWHPVHPILVSGGSEGAILHWDLSSSDVSSDSAPTTVGAAGQPSSNMPASASMGGLDFNGQQAPLVSTPRATLSQAHDSNVWALTFHPLGHILVSGSNDHTTRFWSRERPGDASSVFSGGGEKPPEMPMDMSGQDEEDEVMVPGFGAPGLGAPGLGGGLAGSWGREEDSKDGLAKGYGAYENGVGRDGGDRGYGQRDAGGGGGYGEADDYAIPGFGGGRDEQPAPARDYYGGGASNGYGHYRDRDREGRGRDWGDRDGGRAGGAGGGGGYGYRRGGRY